MKKIIISIIVAFIATISSYATTADTTAINSSDVSKWITEEYTNSKGNKAYKYYCIYKDELVNTNKTTYSKVEFTNKYACKITLYLIDNKGKKRIIVL